MFLSLVKPQKAAKPKSMHVELDKEHIPWKWFDWETSALSTNMLEITYYNLNFKISTDKICYKLCYVFFFFCILLNKWWIKSVIFCQGTSWWPPYLKIGRVFFLETLLCEIVHNWNPWENSAIKNGSRAQTFWRPIVQYIM